MSNEWFASWFNSPYYHLLYKHRSDVEANAFVQQCVHLFSASKHATLLDLACGKGRHAVAFAQHGLDVTGLDLSSDSIEFAKQFETEFLHFYVHDMRDTFRTNYYDFVCNLFTSFGYFQHPHDNELAAQSIAYALKKNGQFLIDFVNRNHAIQNIENNRHEIIIREGVTFTIDRSYTDTQFLKKINIEDGDKKISFQESVNSFTAHEMKTLFTQVGLICKATYGNYNLEAYDEMQSPRMILLFEK